MNGYELSRYWFDWAFEIDYRYGLIEVLQSGQVYCKRKAKFLHMDKNFNNDDVLSMCRNFTFKQCVNKGLQWNKR